MNIFVPQSIKSQIELEEIADVKYQIIVPSTSRTIIGIVQDGILGAYNLTNQHVAIDWRSAMNIAAYTSSNKLTNIPKTRTLTGHELFSVIIPDGINVNNGKVNIVDSVLKDGRLSDDTLGYKKKSSLHQLIWDEYGVDKTQTFLDDCARLINNFNFWYGHTMSIGDIYIDKDLERQFYNDIQALEVKVGTQRTEIENNPDLLDDNERLYEMQINTLYNVIREDFGKVLLQNLKDGNNLGGMILSGAKGSVVNLAQMSGAVGLQMYEGGLIPKKLNRRTLPYFYQDDDGAESRGLVRNSYLQGMNFPEFVYHTAAGREGLVGSAIKTAESGYIQRKLIKTLEDLMIKYDNTVRTANNAIVQFVYGDTGADTTRQYEYNIKLIEMSDSDIVSKFKFDKDDIKDLEYTDKENNDYVSMLQEMRDLLRENQTKTRMDYLTLETKFLLPVNIQRLIQTYKNKGKNDKTSLKPRYIMDRIEYILDNSTTLLVTMKPKDRANDKSIKYHDDYIAKTSLRIALHDAFGPKRCIQEYKLSKEHFDQLVNEIVNNYNKNMVEPGEMAGIIAAQSMGEPVTQMNLNSFHKAGVGEVSETLGGVPRIKECLSQTKEIKTPQMVIYLVDKDAANKEMIMKISNYIKYTTVGHVRNRINVYYDPEPTKKDGYMDKDRVYNVYYTHNTSRTSCQTDYQTLPWLMRIEMNRQKMLEKEVSLLEIKSKFCNAWEKRQQDAKNIRKEEKYVLERITQLAVLSNTDNDDVPVIHIRFDTTEFSITLINDFIDYIIDRFKLKGIPGVESSGYAKKPMINYNNPNREFKKEESYRITTRGVNMYDIRYINGINIYKTVTNDIVQMYKIFGIEAARATLMKELYIAYDEAKNSVNPNHLAVLIDMMTSNGYIISIDRHGMNKTDIDPLTRASFEKTVDQLVNAAVFGETDYMRGVSSRIMAGLAIKGGTGYCDLIADIDMIQKSEFTTDIGQKYRKTYVEINKDSVIKHVLDQEEGNEEGHAIFVPE